MFDIQLEFEILQNKLQDLLALDCLEGDMLADALMDLGYVRCVIDYQSLRQAFNTIEAHIEEYKKAIKC